MARPLPPASRGRTVTPSPQSCPIWWPSNWTTPALNLNAKRLPILARIYGAVVLLDGLATLPIMVISILYAVREILDGHVHVDAMSLTFILSAIHAVVLVVSAACLIVLGGCCCAIIAGMPRAGPTC